MRTIVLLADAAQTDTAGKLHALGLGWTVTSTPTPPAAVIAIVEVEWTETNMPYKIDFDLVDEDGHPVTIPGPMGESIALHFESEFELGRPPGLVPGTPLTVPFAVPLGAGIPLAPGKRYRWRVLNSGQPGDDIGASFYVRPAVGQPG